MPSEAELNQRKAKALAIRLKDRSHFSDVPRISDLDLSEMMGLKSPRLVRLSIERQFSRLSEMGKVEIAHQEHGTSLTTGKYYLTHTQAMFICARVEQGSVAAFIALDTWADFRKYGKEAEGNAQHSFDF